MGLIGADTSILVDTLRGVPEAREAIPVARDAQHEVGASVLTKVELLSGMRSPEKSATRRLIASLMWVAVSDEVAEAAGELARAYRRSHQGIGVVDFVIAATVEHLGAQLWTLNIRHFPMFPDLVALTQHPEYPSATVKRNFTELLLFAGPETATSPQLWPQAPEVTR